MRWNVPNSHKCPGKFSISENPPVSQTGTSSDHVWAWETRHGARKAAGEQGSVWAMPPRTPLSLMRVTYSFCSWHLLLISHEATGGGGWVCKLMNHSCGISLGFWTEKTRIIWPPSMSVFLSWDDQALRDTEQDLEIFLVVKLRAGASSGTFSE